jgi:capsular exopolysaccharide synthesis family protein
MSKIHDALKKVEQERSAGVSGRTSYGSIGPDVSSAHAEGSKSSLSGVIPATGNSEEFLRFDHLLKNCAKPAWHLDPHEVLFCGAIPAMAGAEQFRTLRSRLYHMRETLRVKKVLVTSALSGEGKTFVAVNLAQAIARQRDRRVLLIDGDLRRSRLHIPLGAPLSPGLSEYLRGEATEMAVIQHGMKGDLCFIPAGNPCSNPSELLASERMGNLLDRLAPVFDWIIIDTAPTQPVSDASLLGSLCDGVLLVVQASSTSYEVADRARKEFKEQAILGVVLNRAAPKEGYLSYYHEGRSGSSIDASK